MATERIPVEVLVNADRDGNMKPFRIRYQVDDDELQVINIKRIIQKDKRIEVNYRSSTLIYKCEAIDHNTAKQFTLQYNTESCKWIMLI